MNGMVHTARRTRAGGFLGTGAGTDERHPRVAAAMLESAVRFVQAFPDAPSAQLRLCEGLEGILAGIADRIGSVAVASVQRRQDADRVDTLAHLLAGLPAGTSRTLDPFTALAEA